MNPIISILLQAIASDDIITAKMAAIDLCNDSSFGIAPEVAEWLSKQLALKQEFELPPEVAALIEYEDVSESFNPRRYWVSEREQRLLEDIINLNRGMHILRDAKIPFLNATLLFGVSGVGKTQFGRYLAYIFELPFVYVNLSKLCDPTLGGTARNLDTIFNFVNANPCLFMLDELDAIGANRGSYMKGGTGDEMTRTTIALMQCLDKVRRDAVILAATNRSDMLDAAVLRRFSVVHEIKAFTPDEMTQMAVSYLTDVNETGKLDITWDIEDIKKNCHLGKSQAEIINVCNRAVVRAVMSDKKIQFGEVMKNTKKTWW